MPTPLYRICVSATAATLAIACTAAGGGGGGVAASPANDTAASSTDAATTADTPGDTAPVADTAADGAADSAADVAAEIAGGPLCKAVPPKCTDNQILDLALLKKPSTRVITNTTDGAQYNSEIDATAGGMTPNEAFVYARFGDFGLERVDIHDHAALDSQKWDIAFRRYVIRLNSGVSGPSCVVGGPFGAAVTFDQVVKVASSVAMAPESYYDEACKLVVDGSGLDSPGTVLSSYWKYATCVQMTNKVFQVKLADGRHLKLAVDGYYAADAQAKCDASGNVPPGTPGAKIRLRWAWLTP